MKQLAVVSLAGALTLVAGCGSLRQATIPELPPGRLVKAGGYHLFARQSGSGPDVVLLHGLGDSSMGWQFIEPYLVQAGYRVLVGDALGTGRSEKPAKADYSMSAHVSRLESTMDAFGVREAVIVGHSLGGSEALLLAQRHPERVRALCLIDPAAYRAGALRGRWLWTTPLLAEVVLGVLPARLITKAGLDQNFHDHTVISSELRAMCVREAERKGAMSALIAQERQLIPGDVVQWEQAHSGIRKRTLILWGSKDKLVPMAQGQRLAQDIAGAKLVVFPGIGHSPQLEAPQLVLGQILSYFDALSSSAPITMGPRAGAL